MSNSEVCTIKVNGASAPETKINLTTIKKSDQYIHHIISTTSHVEVYKFDSTARTWERTTTEGSLFIYSRAETPAFGFVVLNRLNSGNILQFVTPGMEFKIQDSFIMYISSGDVYYGLHFDDSNECNRVGDILISISNGTSSDTAGQDVVQMLEKAFHQSAEGSSIAERKQKAIELRKESQRRSSDPNVNVLPRKSASKQQRPSKSTKKESRETQSSSKVSTRIQEIPAKANSERVSTKHLSRANAEEFQDLKRQLFTSPERTKNKEIPSGTENTLSVGTPMLSSSLPHAMLSLAEVEKKLHNSVTTANSSNSSSIVNRARSVETVSQSQLIDPSSFAVPAPATSLPNSKSAARLTKAASLDVKVMSHSISQPVLVDGSTLQVPSHFPPLPPVMVSPGMRSAPVSSSSDQGLTMKPIPSSSPAMEPTVMHAKQQQQPPTTTTAAEGKPLPPSSYQTPNRQTNVESAGKELPVPKTQSGSQNGLMSPMVFQDNSTVHNTSKPTPVLNREQFMQAMLHMIQNDKDFSDRLYQAYQQCLLDSLQ